MAAARGTALLATVALVAVTGLVLTVLPAGASPAKPKRCGSVVLKGEWGGHTGSVEVVSGGYSCATAMRVARKAASKPFSLGEMLPAPAGWHCGASMRPSAGYHTNYAMGCWRHTGGIYEIGVG